MDADFFHGHENMVVTATRCVGQRHAQGAVGTDGTTPIAATAAGGQHGGRSQRANPTQGAGPEAPGKFLVCHVFVFQERRSQHADPEDEAGG